MNRVELFGKIDTSDVVTLKLSSYGKIVDEAILEMADHYDSLSLDKYIVMPNHIHMILFFDEGQKMKSQRPMTALLPTAIAALKRITNKRAGRSLWQASYHDHIIRDEKGYLTVWSYIDTNPQRWADDEYYSAEG
ncbi:MAG: hypothetical protein FWD65_06780 [Coriobacteriia bacterium]|nr:hypothetical protein [Coriobacteriia bacterium]